MRLINDLYPTFVVERQYHSESIAPVAIKASTDALSYKTEFLKYLQLHIKKLDELNQVLDAVLEQTKYGRV